MNAWVVVEPHEAKKMFKGPSYKCKLMGEIEAEVQRKPSDFSMLYDLLLEMHPYRVIPKVPDSITILSGSTIKRLYPQEEEATETQGALTNEQCTARLYANWLTYLVTHPVVRKSPAVKVFFMPDVDLKAQFKTVTAYVLTWCDVMSCISKDEYDLLTEDERQNYAVPISDGMMACMTVVMHRSTSCDRHHQ